MVARIACAHEDGIGRKRPAGIDAVDAVRRLSDQGFGVWAHDNWYSLGLREKLPYPDSAIRVGLIHYNTADEIDRFNAALAQL